MKTTFVSIDWGGTSLKGVTINNSGLSDVFELPSINLRLISDQELIHICQKLINIVKPNGYANMKWLIGAAGASNPSISNKLISTLEMLSNKQLNIEVYPDYLCNHAASLGGKDGILSVNGTGSIIFGINGNKNAKIGGWGYLFDETPSGSYFGKKYLEAVLRGLDGEDSFKEYVSNYQQQSNNELINRDTILNQVYSASSIQNHTGKYAKNLVKAYEENDEYAINVINNSILQLSHSIKTLTRKLDFDSKINFCGSGGLWENWKNFKNLLNVSCEKLGVQLIWYTKAVPLWLGPIYYFSHFNKESLNLISTLKINQEDE